MSQMTAAAEPSRPRHEGASFPVRRPGFDFNQTPRYWFDGDPFMSHFMNGLSALFPDGEMFFVKSVRELRDQVRDEKLQREISAFIGQEAMHSKTHLAFDDYAQQQGLPLKSIERVAVFLLRRASRWKSKKLNLAVTCALEHFTATWAQQLLSNEGYRSRIRDPQMLRLWTWHAIEETEHKAVAYDVYQAVGGGYFLRALAMVMVMLGLTAALVFIQFKLMAHDRQLLNLRSWGRGLWTLFGFRGFFTPTFGKTFDYFRPGFHPNDHADPAVLDQRRREMGFDALPAAA